MRGFRSVVVAFLVFASVFRVFALDQLLFENGDVITGRFLGKTESLIYFESQYFGTLKIPTAVAELKLETPLSQEVVSSQTNASKQLSELTEPAFSKELSPQNPPSESLTGSAPEPEILSINEETEEAPVVGLGLLWESAERTLNRFVHDRVPAWFPQLPDDWKAEMKLGVNINEAVSTSTRYYGEFTVEGENTRSNYLFKSHFAYAKQDETISENDWGMSARYRYKLRERSDFFETLLTHDVDQLFEPQLRTTSSVGFGIKPFNEENFTLDTVFGGALERLDRRDSDPSTGFRLNFNENLRWSFNKQLSLKQSLRFYLNPDEDLDFNFRFETGLDALIVGAFNLGLSYRLDYDSSIEDKDARQKSRVITSVGIKF